LQKDNPYDRKTKEFLLYKDRKEKVYSGTQKQECGCPSLQASLRSHTHAFQLLLSNLKFTANFGQFKACFVSVE